MDRSSPMHGTHWTISAGPQQAGIVQCGAALQSYRVGDDALVDGFGDDELPVGHAGQLLAPWPNRIAGGRYSWQGRHHQLPLSEPSHGNAIHGLVCWEPWTLLDRAADRVRLERSLYPRPGYPFAVTVAVEWSVSDRGLACQTSATNHGADTAPFGFGAHPYLQAPGAPVVDQVRLVLPARTRLLVDERLLPVGREQVADTRYDFRNGAFLAGRTLDDAFTDVVRDADGTTTARLVGPDGRGVEIWADEAFGYWQVFTSGTRATSVAVEPMTCPGGAFNSGTDLVTLAPGDTWTGAWGIRPC